MRSGLVLRLGGIVLIVLLVFVPSHVGVYGLNLATVMVVYGIAVLGLDLINGFGGLLSLGQGGFFGIGCYAVALGGAHTSLPGVVLLLLGVGVSVIIAVPMGLLVSRRGQTVCALVTLAFALIMSSVIEGLTVTGGPTGLPVTLGNLVPGLLLTPRSVYEVALGCVVVTVLGLAAVRASSGGRALSAGRYSAKLGEACGVDVRNHKLACFVIGSALAAVGGGLYAYTEAFVSPSSIGLTPSILFLLMLVIGGAGTGWGGLIGVGLIAGLPGEVQRLGNWQQFGTGVIALAVLVWFRRGIGGSLEYWIRSHGPQKVVVEAHAPGGEMPRVVTGPPGTAACPALEAKGLSRHFAGVMAVTDMDLSVHSTEIHGLIGPNGAGKTTLLNLLSGADRAGNGMVRLEGGDVSHAAAHVRTRMGLARTFQHAALVPGLTTTENLLLGAHTRIRGRVGTGILAVIGFRRRVQLEIEAREILCILGLGNVADKPSDALTGGQRRLAEVARCVLSGARVLLLDEPAAGLNEVETAELGAVLLRVARSGRAILLVEHDMSLVMSVSDRVTVMELGQRLSVGTPAEVAADDAVVEAYLGV